MTDIVERLRIRAQWEFAAKEHNPEDHIDWQAADEIERLTDERDRQYDYNCGQIVRVASLEAEIERLRKALKPFAKAAVVFDEEFRSTNAPRTGAWYSWNRMANGKELNVELTVEDLREARAALEGKT